MRQDPIQNAYWDQYYCPVQNRKEKSQNLDYVCLQAALISIKTNSLLYTFSDLGAGPKPWHCHGGCLKPV